MLELLGTMVWCVTDKWEEVLESANFLEFIHSNLVNGYAEDDIVLEFVMLIATICRTEKISMMIAESDLIKMLQDLLGAKQEDDEMVQ
jgi:glycerol-3-phosphate responsive antiterminator